MSTQLVAQHEAAAQMARAQVDAAEARIQAQKLKQGLVQKQSLSQQQATSQQQAVSVGQEQALDVRSMLSLDTSQVQDVIQRQEERQVPKQITEQISKQETELTDIPKITKGLRIKKVKLLEKIKEKVGKEQGYDVLVKRKQLKKGKGSYQSRGYKKANVEPLTRTAALGLGGSVVDLFTNRSFMIKKAKKKAVIREDLEQKWERIKEKFRQKKKNRNILVEKVKYAIDSIEEKKGIPYEAARLRKLGLLQTKSESLKVRKQQLTSLIKTKKIQIKKQKLQDILTQKKKAIASNFLSSKSKSSLIKQKKNGKWL